MEKQKINIHWFRRDLRLNDNHALHAALTIGLPVLPIFIFDTTILQHLPKKDARVEFIHASLSSMQEKLISSGSSLRVYKGNPEEIFKEITEEYNVQHLFANRDYEPNARRRDKRIYDLLKEKEIQFIGKKDQVIFEASEVAKDDGLPYTVYTPYSKKWKTRLSSHPIASFPSEELTSNFLQTKPFDFPSLEKIGFEKSNISFPSTILNTEAIKKMI